MHVPIRQIDMSKSEKAGTVLFIIAAAAAFNIWQYTKYKHGYGMARIFDPPVGGWVILFLSLIEVVVATRIAFSISPKNQQPKGGGGN